jgi:hypothetical protein
MLLRTPNSVILANGITDTSDSDGHFDYRNAEDATRRRDYAHVTGQSPVAMGVGETCSSDACAYDGRAPGEMLANAHSDGCAFDKSDDLESAFASDAVGHTHASTDGHGDNTNARRLHVQDDAQETLHRDAHARGSVTRQPDTLRAYSDGVLLADSSGQGEHERRSSHVTAHTDGRLSREGVVLAEELSHDDDDDVDVSRLTPRVHANYLSEASEVDQVRYEADLGRRGTAGHARVNHAMDALQHHDDDDQHHDLATLLARTNRRTRAADDGDLTTEITGQTPRVSRANRGRQHAGQDVGHAGEEEDGISRRELQAHMDDLDRLTRSRNRHVLEDLTDAGQSGLDVAGDGIVLAGAREEEEDALVQGREEEEEEQVQSGECSRRMYVRMHVCMCVCVNDMCRQAWLSSQCRVKWRILLQ